MDVIRKSANPSSVSMDSNDSSKETSNPLQSAIKETDTVDESPQPIVPETASPVQVPTPSKPVDIQTARPVSLPVKSSIAESPKIEPIRPASVVKLPDISKAVPSQKQSNHPLDPPQESPRPSDASSRSSSTSFKQSEVSISSSLSREPSLRAPPEKSGYLEKLSPKMLVGWQKRYFVLKYPGILLYFGSEAEVQSGNPKGDIPIADILPGSMGVKLNESKNEITIMVENRNYPLRASNLKDAEQWVTAIKVWREFVNGND
jgi:hypothetical protein